MTGVQTCALPIYPLATQLQSCDSPSAIIAVLQIQVQTFDQSQSADEKWTKWLDPTVNVLFAFSATLSNGPNGVGLVLYVDPLQIDHRYFRLRMPFLLDLASSST